MFLFSYDFCVAVSDVFVCRSQVEQHGAAGGAISAGGDAAEPNADQTRAGWKQHSQRHAPSHR